MFLFFRSGDLLRSIATRFCSNDFEIWKVLRNPRRFNNWSDEDWQKKKLLNIILFFLYMSDNIDR
uniref:Uncharacterized protein n=1 Tax=Caenorhabditis japonica TaxID=281687 RepID=A0A8R1HX61_CAEJA